MSLNKLMALYLQAVAVAVAVHFVIYPFYGHEGEPGNVLDDRLGIWLVLDWFMAAGLVILVLTALSRRMAMGDDADTASKVMLYGGISLTIAFLPNWFEVAWGELEASNGTIWHLTDSVMPVMFFIQAKWLWRKG